MAGRNWDREHARQRAARPDRFGGLARETGWGVSRITQIEEGAREIDPNTMRRYRMACAAAQLGAVFDWRSVSLAPPVLVAMTVRAQEPAASAPRPPGTAGAGVVRAPDASATRPA